MEEVDQLGDLTHDGQQLGQGDSSEAFGRAPVKVIPERAFGKLHADDQEVVRRPGTEVRQEIGMANRA
jgi:hypothetical protein